LVGSCWLVVVGKKKQQRKLVHVHQESIVRNIHELYLICWQDMKGDIKENSRRTDALSNRIDALSARLDERFDRVDDKIDSLRTDIYARFK